MQSFASSQILDLVSYWVLQLEKQSKEDIPGRLSAKLISTTTEIFLMRAVRE
jgi:hypothetical protein